MLPVSNGCSVRF
jgi:hypothetical protein